MELYERYKPLSQIEVIRDLEVEPSPLDLSSSKHCRPGANNRYTPPKKTFELLFRPYPQTKLSDGVFWRDSLVLGESTRHLSTFGQQPEKTMFLAPLPRRQAQTSKLEAVRSAHKAI